MQLVFATNNPNKIAEVQQQLGDHYTFLGLADIGCTEEIPETTGTIPGNAIQKARYVYDKYGYNCFSEDTGLLVDALDGAPGVDTAYYAGPARDAVANMQKVLGELGETADRSAHFQTVICLIIDGEVHTFTGLSEGAIAYAPAGTAGFGYDPIFIPQGETETFAEMGFARKKDYSHRARAMRQLVEFLDEGMSE
ncbi:MAG: RdgB/HAM1 family non-canonical purine NTP pyrophosphatase [Bacteroidota bacterium]